MRNDYLQIEFEGFDPNYEVRNFISTLAEKVHLNSPTGSAVQVTLKLSKGAILASCRIASHAGMFIAEAISEDPIGAIEKVEKNITEQLECWKRRRYVNGDSHIPFEAGA